MAERGEPLAPSPARTELIDFAIERQRHRRFVERADVPAQLDEWLLGPGEAGWIVVTGGPGMGKSVAPQLPGAHHPRFIGTNTTRYPPRGSGGVAPASWPSVHIGASERVAAPSARSSRRCCSGARTQELILGRFTRVERSRSLGPRREMRPT